MLKIEVVGTHVKTVHGKAGGKNEGKTFEIPEVTAYAGLPGERYPAKMVFPVPQGQQPPAPGMYMLAPESFYVDQFGTLQLRRSPVLSPIKG